ncbi:vacuolar protein sorting-associated protein 33A-like, partial [Contarinia nasturtii]|uniref:vacuolar protein sorting-associated protein 33A-like n=1 Tax=Contarinia nasturtii TaxID=265458 RepID=UPI0012D3C5A0
MDITLDKKLQGFRQIAQEKLQNILCSIPDNQKYLIIETCLIQPLEHICGASWLRAKGVNKIYKFDSKNPPPRTSTMVYFISSNLITFKNVLDQIQGINIHQQTEKQISDIGTKPFHLIVLPNVLHSFDMVLEECGLFGYVELHRFNWDFISIDTGVLSLEIPQVFKEVFIRGDTSLLSSVAHSLRILNLVCRKPSMVITVGENAAKVANMIDQIEGFESTTITSEENSDFHTMVIMDRN